MNKYIIVSIVLILSLVFIVFHVILYQGIKAIELYNKNLTDILSTIN